MTKVQSNVSLNSILLFLIIFMVLSSFDFSIPKKIPATEINTVKQLTKNIKLHDNKLYNNFTVKNMVSLNIIPYSFKNYIDKNNPHKSYIETPNGIKIYPLSKDDVMFLILNNFSKSSCNQYAEGLKDEPFYSSIIINNVLVNKNISNANCHLLGNKIELKL